MRLKTIIFLLIGCGFLIHFTSCNVPNNREHNQFNAKDTFFQLDSLLTQINSLDTRDCKNLDAIVTLNEKMRGIVEGIRSPKEFDELVRAFDADKHKIGFLVSEDDLFGVFSWQTKMDCLGHGIKNIAFYKSDDELLASSLYGKPMIYDKITLERLNQNKTIYLLHSGVSKQNQIVTKGYSITNGILVESQIPLSEQSYNGYTITTMEKETDSIPPQ